jgi:glycine betaine catabolism A
MGHDRHPLSPRLDHCPEGLPQAAYFDDGWYAREMATLFARQWVMVGRLEDMAPGKMRRVRVGAAEAVLCRTADGAVSAFHNSCRHRGSELCRAEVEPLGKLVTCPYHAWAYAAIDGRLVSTAFAVPTEDFRRQDHGLIPLAVNLWAGFVFLSAARNPPDLWSDVPLATLANWPMEGLVTGHRHEVELACNWKAFWENYSECLHCPGIHPELCDMVPVYGKGVMSASEALGWTPGVPVGPNLKPGAQSWTMTGAPCGPVFPGLTEAERWAGYTFVTLWPSAYVVAHVDYVRSVRVKPLSPTRTRLVAEWHFPQETLAQPGFDAGEVADFAKIVLAQDGAAAEMNQRGMASPAFTRARLMPEEYEVHRFHQWVLAEMEVGA